jgi:hypothetical protein
LVQQPEEAVCQEQRPSDAGYGAAAGKQHCLDQDLGNEAGAGFGAPAAARPAHRDAPATVESGARLRHGSLWIKNC